MKKKLIKVALPLDAINKASAREQSIRHGHPSTLHLWWARHPLSTCRAVLFAQLVDDPSAHSDRFPTEEAQNTEQILQNRSRYLQRANQTEHSLIMIVVLSRRAGLTHQHTGPFAGALLGICRPVAAGGCALTGRAGVT